MRKLASTFRLIGVIILTIISGTLVVLGSLTGSRKPFFWVEHYLWGPGLLWVGGVKLKIEGLENLTLKEPAIYISNHASYFDIPTLFKGIPIPIYFLAKKELKKVPFLGWAIWAAGMIFIDRSNREAAYKSLKDAGKLIRNGKNILSFPEGTRSVDGKLKTFKKGTFVLALQENIPIVPIGLLHTYDIMPSGSSHIEPGEVLMRIGKPFIPSDMKINDVKELADKMHDEVEKLLQIDSK